MRAFVFVTLLLGLLTIRARGQSAAPPSVSPSPTEARATLVQEQMSVLDLLRKRVARRRDPRPPKFRLSRLGNIDWPKIEVSEVRHLEGGDAVVLAGRKDAYATGATIPGLGVQVIRVIESTVTLEFRQEQREFPVPLKFPVLVLRTIESLHGATVAYFVGDKHPYYEGEKVQDATIRRLTPRAVTLEYRGTQKVLALAPIKAAFPVVAYLGSMGVGSGKSAILVIDGKPQETKVVGETIAGVKVVDIQGDRVTLRFGDEVRIVSREGVLPVARPSSRPGEK